MNKNETLKANLLPFSRLKLKDNQILFCVNISSVHTLLCHLSNDKFLFLMCTYLNLLGRCSYSRETFR